MDAITARTFHSNVGLYLQNILSLMDLRPSKKMRFRQHNNTIIIEPEPGAIFPEEILDTLCALNSSIVLNSFALFEACFERQLLKGLNTENLSGIHEKVVDKYIEQIIELSSVERYEKEFAFIKDQKLSDFLDETGNQDYEIIRTFYVLRHFLIHGSASKQIIEIENGIGNYKNDPSDKKYQKLITFIKSELNLTVSDSSMNLRTILYLNEATDLLAKAVFSVSNQLLKGTKHGQFRKENLFNSNSNPSEKEH